jgi:hypothetical protein
MLVMATRNRLTVSYYRMEPLEPVRDRLDDSRRGEHPDLDGGDIDVFENRIDLSPRQNSRAGHVRLRPLAYLAWLGR